MVKNSISVMLVSGVLGCSCYNFTTSACCIEISVDRRHAVAKVTDMTRKWLSNPLKLSEGDVTSVGPVGVHYYSDYMLIEGLKPQKCFNLKAEIPLVVREVSVDKLQIVSPVLIVQSGNDIRSLDIFSKCFVVNTGAVLNANCINFDGDKVEIRGSLRFLDGNNNILNFLRSFSCCDVSGEIVGKRLKIEGNLTTLRNWGNMEIQYLEIVLDPSFSDVGHYGTLKAKDCTLVAKSITHGMNDKAALISIGKLSLPNPVSITVANGKFQVGSIRGNLDFLCLLNNKCNVVITELKGNVKRGIDNRYGNCFIEKVSSAQPYFLISRGNGASSSVKSSTALSGIVSKEGAVSSASNISSIRFIRVDESDVELSSVQDVGHMYSTGDSALTLQESTFGSIISGPASRLDVRKSKVSYYVNQAGTYVEDTEIGDFVNRSHRAKSGKAKALFSKRNSVKNFENYGSLECMKGEFFIDEYIGRDIEAKLGIREKNKAPLIESEKARNVFQGKGATIYIEKMRGLTKVEAPYSTLYGGFVPGLQFLNSHLSVYLDYMPDVEEFPVHKGGSFNLRVSLSDDYSNNRNKIFGDAIFFVDMNGYNWKNIDADFATKGLEIINAGIMGNYDGRIALEDFLTVKATEIINQAEPICTSREISKSGSEYRHANRCPNNTYLYLQQSRRSGIFAKEDISLDARGTVRNKYATVASREGNIKVRAGKDIHNVSATFAAQYGGNLSARKIINKEATASSSVSERKSHQEQLFFDVYTAELRNRSEGAQLRFGDRLKLKGEVHNIGSTIRSGNIIDLGDCPFINLVSTIQNQAEIGGANIHLKTDKLQGLAVQLWTAGRAIK